MLKQSLKAFKLFQHWFNMFQRGRKGVANAFNIAMQQNQKNVEANVEAVCQGLKLTT